MPVRLTVATEGRLPGALEVAAYYVVSESLANIGKYAQASSATVTVARAGGRVLIEVDGRRGGRRGHRAGQSGCVAWPTAWRPSAGGSRCGARPAAARA